MKKKVVSILLALNLFFAVSIPAFAVNLEAVQEKSSDEITCKREERAWYYRVYNGEKQKRLWSITEGCWLTDWMPYHS